MNDISELRKDFEAHMVSDTNNFQEIHKKLDLINSKLDPILDVYRSVLLSKGFIMGLAGVIVALGAMGAGISWLINSVVQK